MIKVENIEVWGFEHAIRGMRNPMNSWDKSDSEIKYWCTSLGPKEEPHYCNHCGYDACNPYVGELEYVVGPNDLDLMRRLYKAGTEHRKYLRQIFVSMDITAPLYWWKEFDTYKIGTVANSCSTMHRIAAKEFELDDFSHEHLSKPARSVLNTLISELNRQRDAYNNANAVKYPKLYSDGSTSVTYSKKHAWWQMIQLLPSSYNQRRTITMNYENVVSIIKQRTGHKLDEWNAFVKQLEELPYIKDICGGRE